MKIVFLDEDSVGGVDLSAIHALGEYRGYINITDADEIVEICADAEVVITNKSPLSRETLARLPHLRLVCIAATGMNNIDLDAAREFGVEVRNAVGYSTTSVAEATFASTLSLLREICYYDHFVKSRDYSLSNRRFNFDRPLGQLCGSRWGIIGLGAIGREVARIATAFGCEVRYFSTSGVVRDEIYPRVDRLEELLAWCDILSIHSPLTEQTHNLIGERELSQMQPHAILVNVARGGIVDEEALCRAIDNNQIASAALDVFVSEPLNIDSPLLKVEDPDRLRLSPHNAWSSMPALNRLIETVADNIAQYIKG